MSLPRRNRLVNSNGLPNAYLRPVNAEPTILVTSADYPADFDLDFSRENVIHRVAECSRTRRITGTWLALEAAEKWPLMDKLKISGQSLGYRRRKPNVSALRSVNPFTVPTNWIVPKKRIEETIADLIRESAIAEHPVGRDM
ncbi:hypothetical protein Ciccas_002769 [Cichlidogyrus casuarinus]|uniref:Uncharacterized protein n=1 Tax=Cichlidogyrus casuarinus TaxID=1844966 RepID=A0ABD2QIK8_9PLAT